MSILHKLEWRYATKQFNQEKELSEDQVTELLEAMNLAPTSYGLQPFTFIVVHNKALQKELRASSYDQPQVEECSHLIVIAAKTDYSLKDLDGFIDRTAEVQDKQISDLDAFKAPIAEVLDGMSDEQKKQWTMRQCYISLGVLMVAAADLKIDAAPMEGFENDKYDQILGLSEKGLHATVICGLGYRAHDDRAQHRKKVRKTLVDVTDLRY